MSQKVVRIHEAIIPAGKILGWQPVVENGRIVGFENPNFGRVEHVAFVNGETGAFLYDGLRKLDGPVRADGHSTPGAVMVVVEERPDGFYLHCQEEYRPIIYDHINGVMGVTVIGFAGGFSKKNEKPSDAALRELLEEQGVKVDEASVEMIGFASDNRASTETCIEVYLGCFRRKTVSNPDEHEAVLKSVVVRIDQFQTGRDGGVVNSAYAMAVEKLKVVAPQPLSDLARRFMQLEQQNPAGAEALVKMLESVSKK